MENIDEFIKQYENLPFLILSLTPEHIKVIEVGRKDRKFVNEKCYKLNYDQLEIYKMGAKIATIINKIADETEREKANDYLINNIKIDAHIYHFPNKISLKQIKKLENSIKHRHIICSGKRYYMDLSKVIIKLLDKRILFYPQDQQKLEYVEFNVDDETTYFYKSIRANHVLFKARNRMLESILKKIKPNDGVKHKIDLLEYIIDEGNCIDHQCVVDVLLSYYQPTVWTIRSLKTLGTQNVNQS